MADIRTLALVCPAAGQTLLAEALLAQAGVIGAAGSIEHGGAVSKYNALERTAGQSLSASIIHFDHQGTRIHLIDTHDSDEAWATACRH